MRHARSRTRTLVTALAALIALATFGATSALAHVTISARTPASGAVLARVPASATITFSGQLRRGTLKVFNASGRQMSIGTGARDPRNVRRLRTELRALANGRYTVRWTIVGGDGHAQSGSYAFRVNKS